MGSKRCLCFVWAVLLAPIGSGFANQAQGQSTLVPRRVFPDSAYSVDATLSRPYGPEVPFGAVGDRLWASSPQGWAFGDDVHWLYLTNLKALDLEIRDEHGPLSPREAFYYPSHVHLEGAARRVAATASYTYRGDKPGNALSRPFEPAKRWTPWGSGKRTDWYAVDFGTPRTFEGLRLWFYDDTGTGGCRPPASLSIERWEGNEWKPVDITRQRPETFAAGENVISFAPVTSARLRVVLGHAGPAFYTGLYGFEAISADGAIASEPPVELQINADKFIAKGDALVVVVRVQNPTSEPRVVQVVPVTDWRSQYQGRLISNRDEAQPDAPSGPWAYTAESRTRLHGIPVRETLRFAASAEPAVALPVGESRAFTVAVADGRDDNLAYLSDSLGFRYEIKPGETRVFKAALEIKPVDEPIGLDEVLRLPTTFTRSLEAGRSALGTIATERQDARDVLAGHVKSSQAWYDSNVAAFSCADGLIEKMYYHRAYTLRKNMIEPNLGALKWPTQSEGRWRSTWYPNVISYGAAHQIREARWLADPRYWSGHLRTWVNNQKPDHIYPSHVTPAGPAGGQYTDWITSSAWDGQLVHPDRALIEELIDKLADNVRGWQTVYDPDGDGLLMVDSHWWTGMEYQPSFFYFSNYRAAEQFDEPADRVSIERVDLTAYNFGNAQAVARLYRGIGQAEKAREFEALASKIAKAVAEKMWNKDKRFFYSLRANDDVPADVKEVIGVYPFYFGMFPAGEGYHSAWDAILDPGQFWTPWPVASVSKECPAYSQDGWPEADGRRATCMWNGPTWPHANSIVLTAMAATLRAERDLPREKASPLTKERMWELFTSFTKAQYRDQNPENPWTGEFYNGETGVWKTAERDYNHSTWLDILIPDVVGLVPRNDDVLEIDPLVPPNALAHFTLDGQRYRGRDVTIVWDAPGDGDDRHADGREGLDVYVDGKLVASRPELQRLAVDMKTGRSVDLVAPGN